MQAELADPSQMTESVKAVPIVEQLNRSEIDIQISTAKQYPRSIKRFQDEALTMATIDNDIASSCYYKLPRGGKSIEGPSARLAEIVAGAWGNLRASSRVVEVNEKDVVSQGVTFDLEKNVAYSVEVRRRITSKDGKRFNDDMINTTCNAACSIALRNSVFKAIPFAYVKGIYGKVKQVAIGDASTLKERRKTMLEKFSEMKVTKQMIFDKLEKKSIEDIDLEDMELLMGVFNAIKDGDTNVKEMFPPKAKKVVKQDKKEKSTIAEGGLFVNTEVATNA